MTWGAVICGVTAWIVAMAAPAAVTMTPAATAHYPIRVVSRMTGLSVDTLRAWERRYQAVSPSRDDRGRAYSDAQVAG